MKVLLVGGLGFVGKHFVKKYADAANLVILSTHQDALTNAAFVKDHRLSVEIGDITDGTKVRDVMLRHSPDVVVHLAALTGVRKCNDNPSTAFSVNVYGAYNVAMGCVASKSKLIFISSREVYGESLSDQTREDDLLLPNNVYGLTKLLGEKIVLWTGSKYDLDYTILRITNIYGPGGDQYAVQAIIKKALLGERIQILGGSQQMNLIYVDDVVDAVLGCLTGANSSRQVFNIGSYDSISVEDMVSRILRLLDVSTKLERLPMREGETLSFRPSLEKSGRLLGWRPSTTFASGLRETVERYRKELEERSPSV